MAEPPGNAALDDLLPVAPEEVLFVYELPIDHLPRKPINCHMQQDLFLPSTMTSPQTSGGVYPQLVEIQLRFHLLPWHTRFAGIAFNCAAQLDKVFMSSIRSCSRRISASSDFRVRFFRLALFLIGLLSIPYSIHAD